MSFKVEHLKYLSKEDKRVLKRR